MLNREGKYTNLSTEFGPTKLTDFLNDKMDKIHEELYSAALKDFKEFYASKTKEKIDLDNGNYKLSEVQGDTFLEPSSVFVICKVYPYQKETYSLEPFWSNNYLISRVIKSFTNLYIPEDTLRDAKIIYLDYVNGRGKMRSRYTGQEFWVDFDNIQATTPIDKEEMTLEGTFTEQYKNLYRNKVYQLPSNNK